MSNSSVQKYLVVYSAIVTVAFCFTVWRGASIVHAAQTAAQQGTRDWKHADYDQLTVHRINIVEPDGTPRWILSDRAEFPGVFQHGKEEQRPDRGDSAGWLTMNDEGTENGGFLFGGYKNKDGNAVSFGHLSFDEYDADQTLSLDQQQNGDDRSTTIAVNENGKQTLSPELTAQLVKLHAMAESPEKDKALHDFFAAHDVKLRPRVRIARDSTGSSVIKLADEQGRDRIVLKVSAGGSPSIQFLDSDGKAIKSWP